MADAPARQQFVVPLTTDPFGHARLLRRVHDAVLSGTNTPVQPRPLISASWQRSLEAGVDPDSKTAPILLSSDEVAEARSVHPLSAVIPLLESLLVSIAIDARHIAVLTDQRGNVLWLDGHVDVRRIAERSQLVEGACWSEAAAGTNGIGTALALNAPVQIHSAEHLVREYHDWTCAAAPIHDPQTGAILGVVDISGPVETVHPATVALANATARLAEQELSRQRSEPAVHDWRPRAAGAAGAERWVRAPALRLTLLGADAPALWYQGQRVLLTPRHAEILALLALHPRGLSGEELALHLYGEDGNPVTVRAEMHRLRQILGAGVEAKPYRIAAPVEADFLRARALLGVGDVAGAVRLHGYPLLPRSESPTIRLERESLVAGIRDAVLGSANPEIMLLWSESVAGRDDWYVHTRLCELLDPTDPRRIAAAARADRLRHS